MNLLFNLYFDLLNTRIENSRNFTSFGEDSIRYDFYYALMEQYDLLPHQIILEQAIPPCQFVPRERDLEQLRQGRHIDKPEFDLRVDPNGALTNGILCEFAYFRSPDIGSLDVTGAYGKLLNEMHRLALLKNFQNNPPIADYVNFREYKCLLICVTDSVMLNYGSGTRGRRPAKLIQDSFRLDNEFLSPPLANGIINAIDTRFKEKSVQLNIIPTANRIYNRRDNNENPNWAVWVWEINYAQV
jgi:hypothetical protein